MRLYFDGGRGGYHDRAVGERVWSNGREDERVDDRVHDRTAGCQVVRGRSRGARDDQAICLDARDERPADEHRQFDHPRERGLGEDDVVQHDAGIDRLARSNGFGAKHPPLVELGGAVQHRLERLVQLVDPDLGEETKAPEVHAENRDVSSRLTDAVGHRQERAVAPEHHDEVDNVRQLVARGGRGMRRRHARQGGCARVVHRLDAALGQPSTECGQHLRCRVEPLLGHEADTSDWNRHARRCRKNS